MGFPDHHILRCQKRKQGNSSNDYQYAICYFHQFASWYPCWNRKRHLSDTVCEAGKLVSAIRFATEVLSGIPSILFGLFGYAVFVVLFQLNLSIISGSLTMMICILPTIVRTTEEALLAVPSSYKEGAMALLSLI